MLSGRVGQQVSKWWQEGRPQLANFLKSLKQRELKRDLFGLVISTQYIEFLKIGRVNDQDEVQHFNLREVPQGSIVDNEIKDTLAIAEVLKDMIGSSGLQESDVVLAIPRSATIVKTITVDNRLTPDEIESRVWLEANRLFPNLIGDIYLDFAIKGISPHDPKMIEIFIVACRKEKLKPYLEIMQLAGLTAKIVDVNYYAYERALNLITRHTPEFKTIAFLNINFSMIDLLSVHEGNLIYTNELNYDGNNLLALHRSSDQSAEELIKNTLSLHLKHAIQFFYSSRPNVRLDRIILAGNVPASIPNVLEYVKQEVNKDVILADPFEDMKISANVDKEKLKRYAPALMLCCGLAIRK